MGNSGSSPLSGVAIAVVAVAAAAAAAWNFTSSPSPPPEKLPERSSDKAAADMTFSRIRLEAMFDDKENIIKDLEPSLQVNDYGRQKSKNSALKGKQILEMLDDSPNYQNLKSIQKKPKVEANDLIPKVVDPNSYLQGRIKIMSYNIWSIKYYKRAERSKAVNGLIKQHTPDIILLQEVTPDIYKYFQSCQWWALYECSVSAKTATRQFFCMMLSKLPVKDFFYKHFVNTKTGKGLSIAKITTKSNKKLVVATCHLKSPTNYDNYSIERVSQAKEALNLLRFSPNVVLGGDMNWDENTDGPFPLIGRWLDAWSKLRPEENGYTYDTESNGMMRDRRLILQKRLDRFFCRLKDFTMFDIEMIGTKAIKGVLYKSNGKKLSVLPSDHYGLILTISPK